MYISYRSIKWYAIALCFAVLFILILINLQSTWLEYIDNTIGHAIYNLHGNAFFDLYNQWALIFNYLGKAKHALPIGMIITFLLLCCNMRKEAGFFVLSLSMVTGLGEWIKILIMRPRPMLLHLTGSSGYSFPSAHAAVSAATLVGTLAFIIANRLFFSFWSKMAWYGLCCVFIVLTGFTRSLLGVHYPSDVIAGFALSGFCMALCSAWFFGKTHDRKR